VALENLRVKETDEVKLHEAFSLLFSPTVPTREDFENEDDFIHATKLTLQSCSSTSGILNFWNVCDFLMFKQRLVV
jgi:hypothetical protein